MDPQVTAALSALRDRLCNVSAAVAQSTGNIAAAVNDARATIVQMEGVIKGLTERLEAKSQELDREIEAHIACKGARDANCEEKDDLAVKLLEAKAEASFWKNRWLGENEPTDGQAKVL